MEAGGEKSPPSPLGIAVAPDTGRYGDTFSIAGTYAGGSPGTPIEIYVDSRIAGNATLDENGAYTSIYRIDRIPAGLHLAYAVAGAIYSGVTPFSVRQDDTAITLTPGRRSLHGSLMTAGGRPVTLAPVSSGSTAVQPIETRTDENGTYRASSPSPPGSTPSGRSSTPQATP